MKKIIFALLCANLFNISNIAHAKKTKDWTFFIYMEASDYLSRWALSNINEMALADSNDRVNIIVQCHTVENIAWRYKIKKNIIKLKQCITMTEDVVQDVVDGMKWATKKYKANHHALVAWDHGAGILDPKPIAGFDPYYWPWEVEPDEKPGQQKCETCPPRSVILQEMKPLPLRGMLFNEETKTFMTNEKMIETCKKIKEKVFGGKKLDILGCDVCKMSMLENGYQIRDYVKFLVGSQNCELFDGWHYQGIFNQLKDQYHSPRDTTKVIVEQFAQYYKQYAEIGIWTQSAIDLECVDGVTNNLNKFVELCKQACKVNPKTFRNLILRARNNSVNICQAPYYTDLHSFYQAFQNELKTNEKILLKEEIDDQDTIILDDALVKKFNKCIDKSKQSILDAVPANATGDQMTDCKGISIYFPFNHIDSSYLKTPFANETNWLDFLKDILNCT